MEEYKVYDEHYLFVCLFNLSIMAEFCLALSFSSGNHEFRTELRKPPSSQSRTALWVQLWMGGNQAVGNVGIELQGTPF